MTDSTTLNQFNALTNFANALSEEFGNKMAPVKLYAHLLSKTALGHTKSIHKHISAFTTFCVANRDAIYDKDVGKLCGENHRIEYSERVYIDVRELLHLADNDSRAVVWKHLMWLSALMDPSGRAKEILKEQGKGNEGEFLQNIIGKVENAVNPDAPPMEAIGEIMKSGVFTELIDGMNNGLQNGDLDLGKLMGTVQTMVTSLTEGQEGADEVNNVLNTMMGSMDGSGPAMDANADPMQAVMGMMGPMMANLATAQGSSMMQSAPSESIAERIDRQAEEEMAKQKDEQSRITELPDDTDSTN